MLSRFIAIHSRQLRHLSITLSPRSHPPVQSPQVPKFQSTNFINHSRYFSSNGENGNGEKPTSDLWKIGSETSNLDDFFSTHEGNLTGDKEEVRRESRVSQEQSWVVGESGDGGDGGVFDEFGGGESGGVGGERVSPSPGFQPWKLGEEERGEDLFGLEGGVRGEGRSDGTVEEREMVSAAQKLELEKEEQALMEVLKGPNRAFGDLVAASGITDAMLDSLIALKNFQDIDGLPPLTQIEDERYEKTFRKSSRYELELQKQEEAAKARVRQVDEKGRAYGTGRRKCSIARVWIQPGEGSFLINDKMFDVYFPMLDHRAALLRPFAETKTLGLWDIKCTVKGGGTTGQVDAIRLGISRALQCWEPGLRPPLREAGFLTRDPRVVERKKPGKAKARKSFQWVKR
ncbi:28S ribosomal protein S9, mitochondrial-like [Chenopodium quinoa]|uniref:Ribosomal protein S9 n=1 Tax=Chenopodium quinoa TaxID=63459 RepID=A0A803MEM8_CHEQI|nr:28S ribosomal protein S9, mitochondrial-like [Chenopodium quinoa]